MRESKIYVLNKHTVKGMFDTKQTKNVLVIECDNPKELKEILGEKKPIYETRAAPKKVRPDEKYGGPSS